MKVEWLKTVCAADRPITREPFTIEVDGRKITLATDGHVMPMIDGDYGFPSPENAESFKNVFATLPKCEPVPFPLDELRALMPPPEPPDALPYCTKCDNDGEVVCPECEGEGGGYCTCSSCGDEHERECEKCGDDGTVPCDCGRKPKPDRPAKRLRIGTGDFDLYLFARVVPHLPDAPAVWQQDHPDRAALLTVGEWRVLVMPLRRDEYSRVEHTINLPETAAA